MADKSGDLEAAAIDDAFQEKIGDLFKTLVTGLMVGGEQKSVEGFTHGINFARRARELALDALQAGPEASAKAKGKAQKV
jgi:hypothetical protein